jgi:UDP-N-acetylglucosamine/UDP-N-acetylgalactosamine 4-epimerase
MHKTHISNHTFLITGGAGFIGSNLVENLLKHNAKYVRVLDNLSNGFRKNIAEFEGLPNFEFVEGDICDLETCKKAVVDIDFISHQAALGSVPRSIKDPIATNAANITGFLNMLVAAKGSPALKRFVYAASSSTYGDSPNLPKVEDTIGKPLSPYAVTKYVNELYADVFAKTYGLEIIGLRYFNVFGPKQDPHGAYAAVIPLFIKAALEKTPPTINGDGLHTRDFTYVANAVAANIKAMFADPQAANQVYNVAYGNNTTLLNLWESICKHLNVQLAPIHGPNRVGDIRDSLADISKARELLDYNPKYDLQKGLEATIEWYRV